MTAPDVSPLCPAVGDMAHGAAAFGAGGNALNQIPATGIVPTHVGGLVPLELALDLLELSLITNGRVIAGQHLPVDSLEAAHQVDVLQRLSDL